MDFTITFHLILRLPVVIFIPKPDAIMYAMVEMNDPLSERELEILRLVATGAANKEIARQLIISPNTVKVHLRNIFTKVGVASRTEATLYALKIGLVRPETIHDPADQDAGDLASAVEPAGAMGLPGIVMEDQPAAGLPGSLAGGRAAPSGRSGWKAWQIALILLASLALIGAGIASSRWLNPAPAPTSTTLPTMTAQAASTPTSGGSSWTRRSSLPAPRKGMGIAEYQNDFYLIAGETDAGTDGAVLRYQPQSDAWVTLTSKPTPVSEIQSALIGEKIYVPGGLLQNGQATDILEVYDPREDAWETRASLPVPLSAYALASFEGHLYLFGGKNGSTYHNNVYVYDPVADAWSEQTAMSAPRAYASAVVGQGKIFVLGGYDGKQALVLNEAYFPSRDESDEPAWETLAPLPQERYAMGAAHLAGSIYLVGGLDKDGKPASPGGLIYIELSDQWASLTTTALPGDSHPAVMSSGYYLYMLGGEAKGHLSDGNYSFQAVYTILVPNIIQNGGGE